MSMRNRFICSWNRMIGHYPDYDECQHAVEEREGAAVAHHPVEVEEHEADKQYVYYVFYAEIYHGFQVLGFCH